MHRSCAIVVLNWNGVEHLKELVPSLLAAVQRYCRPVPVVVVDNCSTDDDVNYLRQHHPWVEVVVAERNDYLFSLNPIIARRSEEVIIVLNNDMRVERDFIAPLVAHFDDPRVFAVSARLVNWDGSAFQNARRRFAIRRWWMYYQFDWRSDDTRSVYSLEAGGGCSAFRRDLFCQLGGFDPLYWPAYLEDIDLSYRAWMQGRRTVFEPRSVIFHREGATLLQGRRARLLGRRLRRNQVLFMMKNVGGWQFVLGFLALFPWRVVMNAWHRNWDVVAGLLLSVPRLPRALLARLRRRTPSVYSVQKIARVIEGELPRLPLALTNCDADCEPFARR